MSLARHEGRLTEAYSKVALLLAGNPLYLWFILGRDGGPWLLLSALSLPFFAATIFMARRSGLAARFLPVRCKEATQ